MNHDQMRKEAQNKLDSYYEDLSQMQDAKAIK